MGQPVFPPGSQATSQATGHCPGICICILTLCYFSFYSKWMTRCVTCTLSTGKIFTFLCLLSSPLNVDILQHSLCSAVFHILSQLNWTPSSGFYLLPQLIICNPLYSHKCGLGDRCCCNISEWHVSVGHLLVLLTCALPGLGLSL